MKSMIKKFTNLGIIMSVLAVVCGVVLIAYPGDSLVAMGVVLAVYLIVHGVSLIIIDIKARSLFLPFNGLLRGIVYIVLGVLLAKNPDSIAVYLGVAIGMWIIMASINNIKFATILKGTGAPWVLMIIIDIIDIIIGALMMFTPVLTSLSATVYAGMVIIIHAVINFVNMILVKKNVKDFEKTLREKIESVKTVLD